MRTVLAKVMKTTMKLNWKLDAKCLRLEKGEGKLGIMTLKYLFKSENVDIFQSFIMVCPMS